MQSSPNQPALEQNKPKLLVLLGGTATGKSSLALELAGVLGCTQIVSADSRLVYKNMNIGTAKPTLQQLALVPHHMIDVVEPGLEEYSLARFIAEATPEVLRIQEKGDLPVLVGGTGFYINGLLGKLTLNQFEQNSSFRETLESKSTEELYGLLQSQPNASIWTMHPNDRFRIVRALEICEAQLAGSGNDLTQNTLANNRLSESFEIVWVGLRFEDRKLHSDLIKARCEAMLAGGLLDECKGLIEKYGELPLFNKTIGYKECLAFLKNQIPSREALVEQMTISTRQYARRQNIYFKTNQSILWLSAQAKPKDNLQAVLDLLKT